MSACAVYAEFHPPTGVTHCEAAYLTHAPAAKGRNAGAGVPSQPDLVLVRTNRLEIFRLRTAAGPAQAHPGPGGAGGGPGSAPGSGSGSGSGGGVRLELVAGMHLHGVVESLAVLSGGRRGGGTRCCWPSGTGAKVSVLEWDPSRHALRTSSLHCFEGDPAALREGRQVAAMPPRVATDPAGRCAAVVFAFCQLALLPALEADSLELSAGGGAGAAPTVGNAYLLNLSKMMGIREVRDCVFLHGYTEPVLLLLHEPDPTWAGRL
ncbi:hypothetical protein HYH03_019150, partial [Edaphochlamys debaryana]